MKSYIFHKFIENVNIKYDRKLKIFLSLKVTTVNKWTR